MSPNERATDADLVQRSVAGDERAFAELIRRHEQPIAALIRYRIGDLHDAEDVLQETILDAWIDLKRLRDPDKLRAWLLQIARNRCRDHHRAKCGRGIETSYDDLDRVISRPECGSIARRDLLLDITAALDLTSPSERDTAKLFYLEGLSIAEIAARANCPVGTVKRRLFTARDCVRRTLGIAIEEDREPMVVHRRGSKSHPFPATRPAIAIEPVDTSLDGLDCAELRWWSIIPRVGECAMNVEYRPDGTLNRIDDIRATRPARVHDTDGVEAEVMRWNPETGWQPTGLRIYGRLTDDKAQWLATIESDGKIEVRTFLDEGFVWAFPEFNRALRDTGLLASSDDGSFRTLREPTDTDYETVSGTYMVRIGERIFTCLRVIGLETLDDYEHAAVTEGYVSESGRTVLLRHYCHPECDIDVTPDRSKTVVVDGKEFAHFLDQLTNTAFGI
jgi:RNA polymerase sigma-70 factor (ECF subfamily)